MFFFAIAFLLCQRLSIKQAGKEIEKMPGKRIIVTGACGYIGSLVISELAKNRQNLETIVAHDMKFMPDGQRAAGVHYLQGDIRDKQIADIIRQFKIDTVVHLVSIVSPGRKHNRDFEHSVDVLGTENLLQACVQQGVKKIIITSSGAAYGYHKDNPPWLVETDTLHGNYEFPYSWHKRLVEEMLARFREQHPELKQLVLRPGTVLGKSTDNQITDLFKKRFVLGVCGAEIPFVFIWDGDVVGIILKGIHEENEGIYNLAGDGAVTMGEIAKALGKPYIRLPAWLLKAGLFALHRLGLTQYDFNQINFLRYRPVLSNNKLKEEFYMPRYSSREVFDFYLAARADLFGTSEVKSA